MFVGSVAADHPDHRHPRRSNINEGSLDCCNIICVYSAGFFGSLRVGMRPMPHGPAASASGWGCVPFGSPRMRRHGAGLLRPHRASWRLLLRHAARAGGSRLSVRGRPRTKPDSSGVPPRRGPSARAPETKSPPARPPRVTVHEAGSAPRETAVGGAAAFRDQPFSRASRRAISRSVSAASTADIFGPGARVAAEAIAPRFISTYLRTARPKPGCCSWRRMGM